MLSEPLLLVVFDLAYDLSSEYRNYIGYKTEQYSEDIELPDSTTRLSYPPNGLSQMVITRLLLMKIVKKAIK